MTASSDKVGSAGTTGTDGNVHVHGPDCDHDHDHHHDHHDHHGHVHGPHCNHGHDFAPVRQVVRGGPKIGRNDPCPCGSGRKYKKCCMQ
ncbi:MAG: SEC-C metal-binding domain-containing protein [Hyphomicrobiaceae bacterium]